MLRLRLIAGVRHIPSCRSPFYTPARSLYQTRAVAAAASAAKARPRTPSSRHRPTMQRGRNSRPGSPLSRRRELSEPFNSEKAILASYPPVGVDAKMLKLPKEPLSLYVRKLTNSPPHFVCENGLFEGREYWRATVHTENGSDDIVGIGDHASKKEAERLAALSAILQAAQRGKLHLVLSPNYAHPLVERTLSDGTVLTLDRAQVFMDFYCHKFGFDPPAITAQETKGRWEVTLFVDGTRLGDGVGINKKLATADCYLAVVANLDQVDPDLWNTFLKETKGRGDAIGLAPPVYVSLGGRVSDPVRLLRNEMTNSELYMKSPADAQVISGIHETSSFQISSCSELDEAGHRNKSEQLCQLLDDYMSDSSHAPIRDQRFSLPIYTRAQQLLELVNSQGVTICVAATGSGKTTQIPQIILDDWIKRGEGSKCNIICTQPRRIAAISVAKRVAKERGQNAGPHSHVGYQVRFDAKLPEMHGSITFCTTGIFLKRVQGALLGGGETYDNRNLDDVTHIIIDEVHERDVDTDLSLAVIKRLLNDRRARNKPLKVILMSATLDPSLFQSYFEDKDGGGANVIDIPGRSFPVNKRYLEDILLDLAKGNLATTASNWVLNERSVAEYLAKEVGSSALAQLQQPDVHSISLQSQTDGSSGEDLDIPFPLVALTVAHVLARSESGHVLVFLPGWEEIQAVKRILLDPQKYPLYGCDFTDRSKYSIHLLHSTIPVAEQQQVFEPSALGVRRVILATNIAETSITIPDVVYVVDTGKVKEKRYDPERHMSSLISAWVGSSNLNQRAGRAGRHRAGEYYGLISKARVETLNPYQLVEMKRADLSNVVMHVKALDFPGMNVEKIFSSLIEPPALTRVHAALETLQMVGALTSSEELTPLGRVLLQLPIDVTLGRMVLYGALFRALDPALTLAAVLSNREPFNSPPQLKAEAAAAKHAWCPPGVPEARSDPLAAIRAYDVWWTLQGAGRYTEANEFCNRNFLNKPVLLMVAKVKLALLQALYQCGVLELVAGKKLNMQSSVWGREARAYAVPDELNVNRDSLAVLGALVAVGSQPNFAVRTSERAFRTYSDKAAIIHPTSTNATIPFSKTSTSPHPKESWERYMVAFVEKSRNLAAGQPASSATTFLRNTTRLDALQYMLFGAYQLVPTQDGLECDGWLPIHGGVRGGLGLIVEFKDAFERCMQRVFEGIHASNVERRQARMRRIERPTELANVSLSVNVPSITSQVDDDPDEDRDADAVAEREVENEDDGDSPRHRVATPLSSQEMFELDLLTRDVVHVLENFSDDRRMFRMRSRPGTPTSGYTSARASPGGGAGRARLSDEGGSAFARSLRTSGIYGTASPLGGMSPMPSRASTPFREGKDYPSGRH